MRYCVSETSSIDIDYLKRINQNGAVESIVASTGSAQRNGRKVFVFFKKILIDLSVYYNSAVK